MKQLVVMFAVSVMLATNAFADGGGEFGPTGYENIPEPVVMPAVPNCGTGYGAVAYRADHTQPWGWACRKVAGRVSGGEGDGGPDAYAYVPEPVEMPPVPYCGTNAGAVPYRASLSDPWGWQCREIAPSFPNGDGNGG